MKTAVPLAFLLLVASTSLFSQTTSATNDDAVLLRLTAESMPSSSDSIPVTLQRVDKPGAPVQLVAAPGSVDAAVIPAGVYELESQVPVEANGQRYQWRMQIPVFDHITRVRLSMANAVAVNDSPSASHAASNPNIPASHPASANATVEVDLQVDPSLGNNSSPTPIELRRTDHPQPPIRATLTNGVAKLRVVPGRYEIVTIQPLSIGPHQYAWDMEAPLTDAVNHVQLSEWQALILGPTGSNAGQQQSQAKQFNAGR